MSYTHLRLLVPVLVGAAAAAAVLFASNTQSAPRRLFARYADWWNRENQLSSASPRLKSVPKWQAAAIPAIAAASFVFGWAPGAALALVAALVPPKLMMRYRAIRLVALQRGLDGFLVALADSLTTVPNLAEALKSLIEHTEPPIKEEVVAVLAEVRLGRSLDEALRNMAARLRLPGMDAAVGAALLGKRTGGDLPTILRRIAAALREMERLDGVVRTKTAEGRSQAWVMGAVPPGLVLMLEKINPEWLAPMWSDPIGWLMLGGAAALEVAAIALIRKIMAVDI